MIESESNTKKLLGQCILTRLAAASKLILEAAEAAYDYNGTVCEILHNLEDKIADAESTMEYEYQMPRHSFETKMRPHPLNGELIKCWRKGCKPT